MAVLFIAQMALIIVAIVCFFLWVWSLSTDPEAVVDPFAEGDGMVVHSARLSPPIFMGILIASLLILSQTHFELCGFLTFWWPGMPEYVSHWSCVTLPKTY